MVAEVRRVKEPLLRGSAVILIVGEMESVNIFTADDPVLKKLTAPED